MHIEIKPITAHRILVQIINPDHCTEFVELLQAHPDVLHMERIDLTQVAYIVTDPLFGRNLATDFEKQKIDAMLVVAKAEQEERLKAMAEERKEKRRKAAGETVIAVAPFELPEEPESELSDEPDVSEETTKTGEDASLVDESKG